MKTLALIFLFCHCVNALANEWRIDGKLDEPQWKDAQRFNQFTQSFPNTGKAPKYATETLLLTTSDGIYVGFKNSQPIRSRKYSGHDQYTSADFNMVFIDFNNDGNTAYEFVATLGGGTMDGTYARGNTSNRDWDGKWLSAVSEDGTNWYSEFFIPWSITTFKTAKGATNEISVYFQRNNVVNSEAYSFPDTNRGQKNFTYEFKPIQVKARSDKHLSIASYALTSKSFSKQSNDNDFGIDIFWKPFANQQLIASINPDFGQVESDELIVNYSAIETLRTDKRPFFTENQSLFDVRGAENLKLVNTRRIGGISDANAEEIHDISAAVKYINSSSVADFGLFVAKEKDTTNSSGKTFVSGRWYHSSDKVRFGQLINYVENPLNNRQAYVSNIDISYNFSSNINVFANILASDIQSDLEQSSGIGATLSAYYNPLRQWQNTLELTYFDDKLDINDMGYQSRNDLSKLKLSSRYDDYQFAKTNPILRTRFYTHVSSSTNSSHEQHPLTSYASATMRLRTKHTFRLMNSYSSQGVYDLISRENGSAYLPKRTNWGLYYSTPTPATFSFNLTANRFQEGLRLWSNKIKLNSKTYFSDKIKLDLNYLYIDSKDWVIGNSNGEVNQYSRHLNQINANLVAKLSHQSDISLIAQWYGVKAKGVANIAFQERRCCQVTPDHKPDDFSLSRFSLQLKYKYSFANNSKFYLVYARNGSFNEVSSEGNSNANGQVNFNQLFNQSFKSPEQNSLTAKMTYQF